GSVGMLNAYQAVYRRHHSNMSLAYMADGFLPDVQQRKAALECFFQARGHVLPNAEQLQREFSYSLGRDTLDLATSAFDEGKFKVSEQLSELALHICPHLKASPIWMQLATKRGTGYEA